MTQSAQPVRVDLGPKGLRLNRAALTRALSALPAGAPVVALIHGFSFMPDLPGQCPHQHILAVNPTSADRRVISWPRHLGLDGRAGLALACGWPARGSLWQAHRRAGEAGEALAELAGLITELSPGRRLDVLCHSMGARVALSGLAGARPGSFGRLILLAAAETAGRTKAAMTSPAGQMAEVVNVTTRENDVFDALYEWLVHGGSRRSVGQGLTGAPPNWRDLWLDRPETLSQLARLGYPVAAAAGRVSHWSPYLRPGVFQLYRALLTGDLAWGALPQTAPARRWSRLFSWHLNGSRLNRA
jgi:hypothetical protein